MYTRSEHATRILRDWSEMLPEVREGDAHRLSQGAGAHGEGPESKETEVVGLTEEVYR